MDELKLDNRLSEFGGTKPQFPDLLGMLKSKLKFGVSFPQLPSIPGFGRSVNVPSPKFNTKFIDDWPDGAPTKISETIGGEFE